VENSDELKEAKAVLTNCFKHFRFALQELLRRADSEEFIAEEVMTSNWFILTLRFPQASNLYILHVHIPLFSNIIGCLLNYAYNE